MRLLLVLIVAALFLTAVVVSYAVACKRRGKKCRLSRALAPIPVFSLLLGQILLADYLKVTAEANAAGLLPLSGVSFLSQLIIPENGLSASWYPFYMTVCFYAALFSFAGILVLFVIENLRFARSNAD